MAKYKVEVLKTVFYRGFVTVEADEIHEAQELAEDVKYTQAIRWKKSNEDIEVDKHGITYNCIVKGGKRGKTKV